jgi:hypothetical protein
MVDDSQFMVAEFAIGGTKTVVVACVTVIFQAIKAALANPVKSLRSE